LIIDEAQNLSAGVLEQLRLLTNLWKPPKRKKKDKEEKKRNWLQIVLWASPSANHFLR